MLINAIDATLEYGEETLHRVGVGIPAHIFILAVIDALMTGKFLARFRVAGRLVSHQIGVLGNLLVKLRLKRVAGDVGHMEGADGAFTLDQREDGVLMTMTTAHFGSGLATDKGLIRFNRLAARPHQAATIGLHGLADTLSHEPRRLVGNPQHTLNLLAADALFAGTHQLGEHDPLVKGNLAALKDSAYGHGKLLTAVLALVKAVALGFPLKGIVIVLRSAMGTHRAVRPDDGLQVFAGGGRILEAGKVKNRGGHDVFS